MNINELNRINYVNIDEATRGEVSGSGTFKEIIDNVYNGKIVPLTNMSGRIIGMSYNVGEQDMIQDNIAQKKFEIRYSGLPIMDWVLKALKLRADGKQIAEVIEKSDGEISVTLTTGEVEIIREGTFSYDSEEDYEDRDEEECDRDEEEADGELPSEITIDYGEMRYLGGTWNKARIKKYLRNKYKHFLSKYDSDIIINDDSENREVKVTNIHWGRAMSASER